MQVRQESFEEYGEQRGYKKTRGLIFYLANEQDEQLSSYGFRYDIGDYDVNESGLYNHIKGFWEYAENRIQQNEHTLVNADEVAEAKAMLKILSPYRDLSFVPHAKSEQQMTLWESGTQQPQPDNTSQNPATQKARDFFNKYAPGIISKTLLDETYLKERGTVINGRMEWNDPDTAQLHCFLRVN
jgi:hypothetical protein